MSDQEFPVPVERFVGTLNRLLESSVSTMARFDASLSSDRPEAVVQARDGSDFRSAGVALVRSHDDPGGPVLHLKARYIVEIDPRRDDLRVAGSTVGLWADVTGGRKRPRPLVRVEYDRSGLGRGRAAAHVHLHANSPELAWMYGSGGRPAPDLHALHFPVGGRRFRPTLEEFLLFLDREHLFDNWKAGWRPKVLDSLEVWERRQARATARQFPDEAIGALETQGYSVIALSG